jgi:hypothetical protein
MTAMSPVDQAGPPCASSAKPKHHTIALLRAAVLAIVMALSSLAATGVAAQESTPPDASPTPEITPAPDARRLELTLQELNDSGVSGTATLYDAGERTIVVIDAEGTGENHPSHIHAGRCDNLTPNVGYPLENVSGDEPTTSVIDVALDNLLANEFAVDLHLAPNELGTLIACAEIEGEPVTPEGAATPTTAPTEATPDATPPSDGTGGVATQTPAPAETPAPTETEAAATEPAAETPAATDAATPVPDESDGTGGAVNDDQNAASLPLFTQGESGVTGTAVLTADGEQTLISILLSGDARRLLAGPEPDRGWQCQRDAGRHPVPEPAQRRLLHQRSRIRSQLGQLVRLRRADERHHRRGRPRGCPANRWRRAPDARADRGCGHDAGPDRGRRDDASSRGGRRDGRAERQGHADR